MTGAAARPGTAAALGQAAVLLGLLGVAWAGLQEQPDRGRVALLVALGVVPVIASLSPWRPRLLAALTGVACALTAVVVATHADVAGLASLERAAWADLALTLPDGLAALNDSVLPAPATAPQELSAVLGIALYVIASCVAWLTVAARNALAGVVAVGVALAYRWTVVAPERPLAAGALALAAVLAVLLLGSGAARRPARLARAGLVGLAVVGLAAGLAAPLQGSGGWVDWRSWDLTPDEKPRGPAFTIDLQQAYGKLRWPETPTVVMRVRSERGLPMRATVFERFDGNAFTYGDRGPSGLVTRSGDTLTLPAPPGTPGAETLTQQVVLEGASTTLLIAGGQPLQAVGPFPGSVDAVGDRVELTPALPRGSTYSVRVRVPDPGPEALLEARRYDLATVPALLTQVQAGVNGPVVQVPVWGSGRERPSAEGFGPYADVYRLARRVAGDADTPYAVVNRIEAFLRSRYSYDEQPAYPPPGAPALADFLLVQRRGFCQHFAGSLALMLRMNGIPARVAVGFTSGRYDTAAGSFEIVDRDAHSWVEVMLPGHGWLPFDATPASGRVAPNSASVSSPDYAPRGVDIDLGGIESTAVRPEEPPAPPEPEPQAEPAPASGGGPLLWPWLVAALVLAVPLAVPVGRAVARARRRRAGDERRRTLAALHDLEGLAARLGVPPDPAATGEERVAALRAALGLDAAGLYRTAQTARFSRRTPPPGTAASAWRDVDRMRRILRGRVSLRRRIAAALRPGPGRRATLGT